MTRILLQSLENVEINSVSDREAMGLPAAYLSLVDEDLAAETESIRFKSRKDLAACVEDVSAPIRFRLAAGRMLALLGDPRLDPLAPAMVYVPEAQVSLGLDSEQLEKVASTYKDTGCKKEWIQKECPTHTKQIASFAIGKYPVTNFEFLQFVKETPGAEIPSSWIFGRYPSERANHPVYTISAESADAYAAWLAGKSGRKFRLPTESEWEYAAAGPDGLEFPWGNAYEADRANSVEEGLLVSTPVGMFPRGVSPFGCFDMAGNVEEYTASDYLPYGEVLPIADDLLLALGTYRVARGGSFARLRDLVRCKRRHGRFPRDLYVMGFRLAETLQI